MMTYRTDFDVAHDCPISEVLASLDKFPGTKIESWTTEGPGGGNPNIVVTNPDRDALFALLKDDPNYRGKYGDDDFLRSLITEV